MRRSISLLLPTAWLLPACAPEARPPVSVRHANAVSWVQQAGQSQKVATGLAGV